MLSIAIYYRKDIIPIVVCVTCFDGFVAKKGMEAMVCNLSLQYITLENISEYSLKRISIHCINS